jgi:hypothetical protein
MRAAVLAGTGIGMYAFSLVDSARSAEDDFLHPVYLEVSFGACGSHTSLEQTADNYTEAPEFNSIVTSGVEAATGGGFMDLSFMGRKYHLMLVWTTCSIPSLSASRVPSVSS